MVLFGKKAPPPPTHPLVPTSLSLPPFLRKIYLSPSSTPFTKLELEKLLNRYLQTTKSEGRLLKLDEFYAMPEVKGLSGGIELLRILVSGWSDRREGVEKGVGWFQTKFKEPLEHWVTSLSFECFVSILSILSPKTPTSSKTLVLFICLCHSVDGMLTDKLFVRKRRMVDLLECIIGNKVTKEIIKKIVDGGFKSSGNGGLGAEEDRIDLEGFKMMVGDDEKEMGGVGTLLVVHF